MLLFGAFNQLSERAFEVNEIRQLGNKFIDGTQLCLLTIHLAF